MAILEKTHEHPKRLFWTLLGPGLLAMIGDNDAGGVISYAVTGVTFGFGWFSLLILALLPVVYVIQEMTMRLGMVSQKSFPTLVFEHFGAFWGNFSLTTLLILNLLTLMTEFIGMSIGLSTLGIPFIASVFLSLFATITFAVLSRYVTKERLALLVGALNLVFIVIAILVHPNAHTIKQAFSLHGMLASSTNTWLFFLLATIGNAVAPWMIFFQGSAVIDKGMTQQDVRLGRLDTLLGVIAQAVIAIAILIAGSALHDLALRQSTVITSPIALLAGYGQLYGNVVRDLFAFGLINAGFLAAITISLSTSWAFSDGWRFHHQHRIFHLVYLGGLVLAAILILIPHLPLTALAVSAQAMAGLFIIPLLFFLRKLTGDVTVMGQYVNKKKGMRAATCVIILVIAVNLLLIFHTILSFSF